MGIEFFLKIPESGYLSLLRIKECIKTRCCGKFKVSPLTVMNAGYTQVQRDLKGTDNGGIAAIVESGRRTDNFHP